MSLRPGLALACVATLMLGALWLYARGHDAATTARDLEGARDHITTRERIDDAIDRPAGCAWPDRLRRTCPAK